MESMNKLLMYSSMGPWHLRILVPKAVYIYRRPTMLDFETYPSQNLYEVL